MYTNGVLQLTVAAVRGGTVRLRVEVVLEGVRRVLSGSEGDPKPHSGLYAVLEERG